MPRQALKKFPALTKMPQLGDRYKAHKRDRVVEITRKVYNDDLTISYLVVPVEGRNSTLIHEETLRQTYTRVRTQTRTPVVLVHSTIPVIYLAI